MLKIVTVPNKILISPVTAVIKFDKKLKKIVLEMERTLISQTDPQGVGLAAPQVGINLALFIVKPSYKAKTEVFVNPKIIKLQTSEVKRISSKRKKEPKIKLEGCLSIPRIWGSIQRNNKILLEYYTLDGQKKTKWFNGFKASIIQHEVDHIQGILFTQRALEQKISLYEEKGGKLAKIEY